MPATYKSASPQMTIFGNSFFTKISLPGFLLLLVLGLNACDQKTAQQGDTSSPAKSDDLAANAKNKQTGNVIFIHPDGAGATHYHALRLVDFGPDSATNWDRLEHMASYTGHMNNSIVSTSNGGATAHAYGIKAFHQDYGLSGPSSRSQNSENDSSPQRKSLSGKDHSILMEAHKAGMATAIINSGHIAEPGTGVFASTAESRKLTDTITAQIIHSGVDIIFSGGETLLLPEDSTGFFGEKGKRKDDRHLILEAKELGYTIVYNKEQLMTLADTVKKVLGVFAPYHTFHDMSEEDLEQKGLPLYLAGAPDVGDMTKKALEILQKDGRQFMMVVEEEGSDNFANDNNASGAIESTRRADKAIGEAIQFVQNNPQTLIITAADSEAGGLSIKALKDSADYEKPLPETMENGSALDGVNGTASKPFMTAPDQYGKRFGFGIAWAGFSDVGGGVISKSHGLNADKLPNPADNTDIYRMMYYTLFGKWLP